MAAAEAVASVAKTAVNKGLKEMHGVVVSAGLMDKTVKVRLGGQRWEPRVQKNFQEPRFHLVHDPRNSARQGDIVAITPSWRVAQHVRHVVKHIIAPYGEGIETRPPVPTLEERLEERAAKRAAKDARRAVVFEERARQAAAAQREKDRRQQKRRAIAELYGSKSGAEEAAGSAQKNKAAAAAAAAARTSIEDVD